MANFKKGDRVMIFKDPITKRDPEGMATIVEVLGDVGMEGGEETWALVHFDGDDPGENYQRIIRKGETI